MSNSLDQQLGSIVKRLMRKNVLPESNISHDNKGRGSMLNKKKIRESYGYFNKFVYSPPASDEERESDEFNDEVCIPSVAEVAQSLLDVNLIRVIETERDFPEDVLFGILMSNFDDFISVEEIKKYIEEIPLFKYILQLKIEKKILT